MNTSVNLPKAERDITLSTLGFVAQDIRDSPAYHVLDQKSRDSRLTRRNTLKRVNYLGVYPEQPIEASYIKCDSSPPLRTLNQFSPPSNLSILRGSSATAASAQVISKE